MTQKKDVIKYLIFEKLRNVPNGYITTSVNMINDLNLARDDHQYDEDIYRIMSSIHLHDLLKPFNKRMVKIGHNKLYGRGGKRPANLYRIEEI